MENLFPVHYYLILVFVGLFYFYWSKNNNKKQKKLVGYIKEIRTHPVKSGKPVQLDSTKVTKLGLKHDRQFALLNQYGTFVTLRKYPKLVKIEQIILDDKILLQAEGMPDLNLPLHMEKKDGDHVADVTIWTITTTGVHISEEADKWFSNYLGLEGCKLYCYPTDGLPRHPRDKGQWEVIPNYDNDKDTMMFTDGAPVMMLSEGSLIELNKQYKVEELKMDRFRPNIVLTGCAPFAEDSFGLIQIGKNIIMKGIYPCERCVAVNIISEKGEMSEHNLLKYLAKNRSGPDFSLYSHKLKGGMFGFNYSVYEEGVMKIGDPVYQIIS